MDWHFPRLPRALPAGTAVCISATYRCHSSLVGGYLPGFGGRPGGVSLLSVTGVPDTGAPSEMRGSER